MAFVTKEELFIALQESLNLQSHYAKLLNQYDQGERKGFRSSKDWIARLREVGKLPTEGEKWEVRLKDDPELWKKELCGSWEVKPSPTPSRQEWETWITSMPIRFTGSIMYEEVKAWFRSMPGVPKG